VGERVVRHLHWSSSVPMRRVHCNKCDQTYFAGPGDRCSLCGESGTLAEVAYSLSSVPYSDRSTWAVPKGDNEATSLVAGFFGLIVGAMLGLAIAMSPGEPVAPAHDAPAAPAKQEKCGLFGLPQLLSRWSLGAVTGAIGGALGSMALVALVHTMAQPRRRGQAPRK